MVEGIIWVRDNLNNFELLFCHDSLRFLITQLTFGITSEISKEQAFKMCEASGWDRQDYIEFFEDQQAA